MAYTTRMRPSDIRFIQSDVAQSFRDERDLLAVFRQLVYGELRANDIAPIEVVLYEGLYEEEFFAFDGNRRLLLFKVSVNLILCGENKPVGRLFFKFLSFFRSFKLLDHRS